MDVRGCHGIGLVYNRYDHRRHSIGTCRERPWWVDRPRDLSGDFRGLSLPTDCPPDDQRSSTFSWVRFDPAWLLRPSGRCLVEGTGIRFRRHLHHQRSKLRLTYLASLAEVSLRAPHDRARAAAGLFVYAYLGFSVPVVASGALADVLGLFLAMLVYAAVQITATAIIMMTWKRRLASTPDRLQHLEHSPIQQ